MSLIRGEFWIDSDGQSTYADGDVGDKGHIAVAFEAALGISLDIDEPGQPEMIPMDKLSDEAVEWLVANGASKEAIEYLEDGSDPRDYALERMGWIRVQGDNFQMWDFDDDALDRIKNFDEWENVEDPEGLEESEETINIEQYKDNKMWTVSLKQLFGAKSAEGLKRYKDGIGKWRNPGRARAEEKINAFPYGFFTPKGKLELAGMNHDWQARAMGFKNVDAALKAGYIRLSYPEGGSGYDNDARVIEVFDLSRSLPMLQKAIRPYYEALGDLKIYLEERSKNEVYETSLSVVALGFADEIRRGPGGNNPPYFHGSHKEWKVYDIDVAHSLGTGFTSAFDHLGLWLTNDKDRAKNYGPLVHEFDITLENPLVIERERDSAGFQSDHQPFAEVLYDEKLAKKYLSAEDRKAIKAGMKIQWRSREIRRVLKAHSGGFAGQRSYYDDIKLAEKLLKTKHPFDDAMHRFYKNTAYWKEFRDTLLKLGHDAILFKDSLIDIKPGDKPHDVIVYLRPANTRAL